MNTIVFVPQKIIISSTYDIVLYSNYLTVDLSELIFSVSSFLKIREEILKSGHTSRLEFVLLIVKARYYLPIYYYNVFISFTLIKSIALC